MPDFDYEGRALNLDEDLIGNFRYPDGTMFGDWINYTFLKRVLIMDEPSMLRQLNTNILGWILSCSSCEKAKAVEKILNNQRRIEIYPDTTV